MCLFADRLSADEMKGSQLGLYFSALHSGGSPTPAGSRTPNGLRLRSTPSAASRAIMHLSGHRIRLNEFGLPGKASTHAPSTRCVVEQRHRLRFPAFTEALARRSHAKNPSLTNNPTLLAFAHQPISPLAPPKTKRTPSTTTKTQCVSKYQHNRREDEIEENE